MSEALLAIPEAAERLGVPKASLRRAAEQTGLLIRMGRVDPKDFNELKKPPLCSKSTKCLSAKGREETGC